MLLSLFPQALHGSPSLGAHNDMCENYEFFLSDYKLLRNLIYLGIPTAPCIMPKHKGSSEQWMNSCTRTGRCKGGLQPLTNHGRRLLLRRGLQHKAWAPLR